LAENQKDWDNVLRESEVKNRERSTTRVVNTISSLVDGKLWSNPDMKEFGMHYYEMLKGQNESEADDFLYRLRSAKAKVDQANLLTQAVKPRSGFVFELMAMTPVFAFGFVHTHSCLPDVGVRLVRKLSPARTRWLWALEAITQSRSSRKMNFPHHHRVSREDLATGKLTLLSVWSYDKFLFRLRIMEIVHAEWCVSPGTFTMKAARDPWSEQFRDMLDVERLNARSAWHNFNPTTSILEASYMLTSPCARRHSTGSLAPGDVLDLSMHRLSSASATPTRRAQSNRSEQVSPQRVGPSAREASLARDLEASRQREEQLLRRNAALEEEMRAVRELLRHGGEQASAVVSASRRMLELSRASQSLLSAAEKTGTASDEKLVSAKAM